MTARGIGSRLSVTAAELDVAWMAQSACRSADTALFFGGADTLAAARAMCAECPVVDSCRTYALGIPDLEGVWAGMDENERRRMSDGQRRRNRSRVL